MDVFECELLNPAEEPGTAVFREICETMSDEMLSACLKVIVPIAQRRGLVLWFTEQDQGPVQ